METLSSDQGAGSRRPDRRDPRRIPRRVSRK